MPPVPGTRPAIFRSLGHRNFRLYFLGHGLSLVGTWMQNTATPWLAFRLTGDPVLLGLVTAAGQLPAFFLSPVAGVVSDRVDRRSLLVVTQALALLQAFLLAALVLTDFVRVWHLVVLSLVLSAVTAFDLPVRQAFLGDMLDDRADLSNAIALNAVVFNSARVVGPSLAAAIMYFAGEGGCFLLNGLSYLAVIASLLAMRRPAPSAGTRRHGHFVRELADGYRYAFGHPVIRTLLALVSVVSLLAVPYIVVLPVFVREVLDGGSEVPGLLMAGAGLGALCGSLFLASRLDIREALPRVSAAVGIAGVGLVAFSVTDRAWAAAAALFVVGAGVVLTLASSNTLIQAVVADDKRGRVLSLYTMAFLGLNPLGSMLAGQLMAVFGPGGTLRVGGVGCLLAAAVLAARLRPLGRLVEGDLSKKEADGSL